jgi:GxxExxY protein
MTTMINHRTSFNACAPAWGGIALVDGRSQATKYRPSHKSASRVHTSQLSEDLTRAEAQRRGGGVQMNENEIGTKILKAAIDLHRDLGPGLLETVYEVTLARELSDMGLTVQRQVPVTIHHKGIKFDEGFRADLVVEEKVLLELKSVERVLPAHKKQVQTYLRLTGLKLGYLLNFGEAILKQGITRCVNALDETPSSAPQRLSGRINLSDQ